MNNVVELLDDDFNGSSSVALKTGVTKPEVLTLLSDDDLSKRRSCSGYPSSPRHIDITDTSAHISKESIEICAPFIQDLSASGRDDLESSKANEASAHVVSTRKRLLDRILDEDSSSWSSWATEETLERDDSSKVNLSHRKIYNLSLASKSSIHVLDRDSSSGIQKDVRCKDDESPKLAGDILEEYPMSSPTTDRLQMQNSRSKGQPNNLFIQGSDDLSFMVSSDAIPEGAGPKRYSNTSTRDLVATQQDLETVLSRPQKKNPRKDPMQKRDNADSLLSQSAPSDEGTDIFPRKPVQAKKKIKTGLGTPEDVGHSEILDLNLAKFLSDDDGSPAFSQNVQTTKASKHIINADDARNELFPRRDEDAEVPEAPAIKRLKPYIVHGKCYTEDESQNLVQFWLKTDKKAFKEANQIYRTNEKARSSIIVEMPNHLIQSFKKESNGELENMIDPATLQASYDQELPKIRFLRRCHNIYDFNHDIYYPCEQKTIEETLNVLYYDAQRFFERYRAEKQKLFKELRELIKSNRYLVVVLSNLNKFERSLDALENKKYMARIQEQLTGSQAERISKIKRKPECLEELGMKKFDIEQRLRLIDRLWGVKIHTVSSPAEFVECLPNLVSLIGKQRTDPALRLMRYSHINVRSSKDKTDVLRQTVHQITRIPELKADSVVAAYPSFQSLFHDFKKGELKSGLDGKHLMTEAMEERLYKLFTCKNPEETIQ